MTVQSDGAAFVTYRTYTWCSQGPPPCDDVQDGQIIGGGNLTIQFTSATPTVASGQIVSNTDPIYPLGAAVSLTLTTNDTVDLRLGSEDVGLFCGARAPVGYCGA